MCDYVAFHDLSLIITCLHLCICMITGHELQQRIKSATVLKRKHEQRNRKYQGVKGFNRIRLPFRRVKYETSSSLVQFFVLFPSDI